MYSFRSLLSVDEMIFDESSTYCITICFILFTMSLPNLFTLVVFVNKSDYINLCNCVISLTYKVYRTADSLLPCITEHLGDSSIGDLNESIETY